MTPPIFSQPAAHPYPTLPVPSCPVTSAASPCNCAASEPTLNRGGLFFVSVRTHIHDLPKQRDDEIPETGTWIVICVSFKRHIETY